MAVVRDNVTADRLRTALKVALEMGRHSRALGLLSRAGPQGDVLQVHTAEAVLMLSGALEHNLASALVGPSVMVNDQVSRSLALPLSGSHDSCLPPPRPHGLVVVCGCCRA